MDFVSSDGKGLSPAAAFSASVIQSMLERRCRLWGAPESCYTSAKQKEGCDLTVSTSPVGIGAYDC